MKTNDLIAALAADTVAKRPTRNAFLIAMAIAIPLAGAAFFATLGPRPDFGDAVQTIRFLFKFVVGLALAASATGVLFRLSIPGSSLKSLRLLWLAPALLAAAVVLELAVVPASGWERRLVGSNSVYCLTFIPMIALGPLVAFVVYLRTAAPTHPALSGAVAGILASGLAATFYAAHCPDDSPLFVATWYTLAIALMAVIGALAGRSAVRW
jgi:hypothetical protein